MNEKNNRMEKSLITQKMNFKRLTMICATIICFTIILAIMIDYMTVIIIEGEKPDGMNDIFAEVFIPMFVIYAAIIAMECGINLYKWKKEIKDRICNNDNDDDITINKKEVK